MQFERKPPPRAWRSEIEAKLISASQLRKRVRELARRIQSDHRGDELVVVALLTGTVIFLADLLRCLTMPLRLDFMGVSSYRNATAPQEILLTKDLGLDVAGRPVLIVDDILDTGRTLSHVVERIRGMNAAQIRICVLLEKTSRREKNVNADYVGFKIPDAFVVGYGLDYAERFRNLPFIGILRPEVFGGGR